jgi:hypothetical protein
MGIIVCFEVGWIGEDDDALACAYCLANHDVDRLSAHELERPLAGDA